MLSVPRGALLALLALALLAAPAIAAESRYGRQKVLYHINEAGGEGGAAYLRAMANIQNHINAVGAANVEIKIVVHGDGIGILKDATANQRLQGQIVNLKNQKVTFAICQNTLTARKIDPKTDLFEVEPGDIVPSGVAEVAHLQGQGYAYIKP